MKYLKQFGIILAFSFAGEVFHFTDSVANGIGIGSASHAIGTSRAMEMGEVEGAMSSLPIVVAGILTVVFASLVVQMV